METKINTRCKKNKLEDVEVRYALSRRDNKTYICSNCGTEEGLFDFTRSQGKFTEEQIQQERSWLN